MRVRVLRRPRVSYWFSCSVLSNHRRGAVHWRHDINAAEVNEVLKKIRKIVNPW
jgi:hypothetical protein